MPLQEVKLFKKILRMLSGWAKMWGQLQMLGMQK